ncbi:Imm10 family immunity protein [Cellulomonas sp. NPDC057328]|uniref:Imm10 family immunity protein n=1 Tax=Cellulomonas sp. NPDC057328 TaxID=3346101 RepID=UPI00363C58EA
MTFRADYVHDEDEGWAALVLHDEATGVTFEVQRTLAPDEQDERLGTDTYCLVVDGGASVYGGLHRWEILPQAVLALRLTQDAATTLGVAAELRLPLHEDAPPVVARALGRLVRRTLWDDLADRRRALALPMVPLRRDGRRVRTGGDVGDWAARPDAVGVGPDGEVVEVRRDASDHRRSAVWRTGDAAPPVVLVGALRASWVQPLPQGRVLLVGAGDDPDVDAEVWDADGRRVAAGRLGGARAHVLATPSGATWIGYGDEAGSALGLHKLVRVGADLAPQWVHPLPVDASHLPDVFDVYALNVVGEAAYCYAYTSFHLVRVEGDTVADLGPVDVVGARAVLLDGARGALVGGYRGRHDVVTPFEITPDGVRTYDPVGRLVDLDGGDVRDLRLVARGDHLYALHRDGRRRVVTLEQLLDGRRV